MNRTIFVAGTLVLVVATSTAAQSTTPAPVAKAQADEVDVLAGAMRAAEAAITRVALTMRTSGQLADGLEISTRGELRVARGEQAALRTRFESSHSDGLKSRVDVVQTADGILLWEEDPVAGEVFLRFDAKVVADLEWAGSVLRRDDLPGMKPVDGAGVRHSDAPLGSGLVAVAKRQFTLKVEAGARDGEAGTWLRGPRRPGLDEDPDLPAADRVELFVRGADHALLEAKYFVGDRVVQHLVVEKLDLAPTFGPDAFLLDAGGRRPQSHDAHAAWKEQVEQACSDAEKRAERAAAEKNAKLPPEQHVKPEVRPSRR